MPRAAAACSKSGSAHAWKAAAELAYRMEEDVLVPCCIVKLGTHSAGALVASKSDKVPLYMQAGSGW